MMKDGKKFLSFEKTLDFIGDTQEFCDSQDSLSVLIFDAIKNIYCCQEDSVVLSDDEMADVAGGAGTDELFFRKR